MYHFCMHSFTLFGLLLVKILILFLINTVSQSGSSGTRGHRENFPLKPLNRRITNQINEASVEVRQMDLYQQKASKIAFW